MINALEIPSEINLAGFSHLLYQRRIRHRITEEGLNQVIWVATESDAEFVKVMYMQFQSGEISPQTPVEIPQFRPLKGLLAAALAFPLTLLIILFNVVCFPIGMNFEIASDSPLSELFRQMMFLKIVESGGDYYFTSLGETLASTEYWRMVTPMLIHFSWLHIVFNLLWVWEVGRRIEAENGAASFVLVVLTTSMCANFTQYALSGPGLFGGMSGVVFGLLGHSFVWSRLVPQRKLPVSNTIYTFMLIYLIVGFTGAIDLLGLGSLANGAHLGGLIGGLVTGGIAALWARRSSAHQLKM